MEISSFSKKSPMTSIKASQSTFYTLTSDCLFILLDCQTYTAGDKVTGEVLLNFQESFMGADLQFFAQGSEEISIYDPSDHNRVLVNEKSEVFSVSTSIYKWESFEPGHYIFPFSLKIPPHCPSTFYFSSEDQRHNYIKASISYEISVTLMTNTSKFTFCTPFTVKNRLALTRSCIQANTVEQIRGCCASQGSTKFILSILNNEHCEVGGSISFRLEPDNKNCKAPINRVISKVFVEITVNTARGEYKVIKELDSIDRAAWVSGLSSLTFIKDFEYSVELSMLDMNLSTNLTPIIKCEYFLQLLVFYDMFCNEKPVELIMNFHVNPQTQSQKEIPKLPENWNPQEFGIIAFMWTGTKGYDVKNMTSLNIV